MGGGGEKERKEKREGEEKVNEFEEKKIEINRSLTNKCF